MTTESHFLRDGSISNSIHTILQGYIKSMSTPTGSDMLFLKIIVDCLNRFDAGNAHDVLDGGTGSIHGNDRFLLGFLHLDTSLTSKLHTPFLGSFDARLASLQNQVAVILGQGCQDLHGEPADCRGCVEIVLQGDQLDAAAFELGTKIKNFLDGTTQAIQTVNDQGIFRTQIIHASLQTFAIKLLAGNLVREDPDASGLAECILLRREVLLSRTDSRISYFFPHISKLDLVLQKIVFLDIKARVIPILYKV
ncbi:hypothetical protein EVA_10677 [gut metagenome]|uniref:Uncharacterized protein n=1 Tax=gut metagenome TaxID=749906 RepID=J9G1X5_9ZZZZ